MAYRPQSARLLLLVVIGFLFIGPAPDVHANLPPAPQEWAHCLTTHARDIQVHPTLLLAIVHTESRFHKWAFGWTDRRGLRHSWYADSYPDAVRMLQHLLRTESNADIGLAQINSKNLPMLASKHHVSPIELLDPCRNLYASTVILQDAFDRHGHTWHAVAAYNGSLTYIPLVWTSLCRVHPYEDCPPAGLLRSRSRPPGPDSPLILTRGPEPPSLVTDLSPTFTPTRRHLTVASHLQESSMPLTDSASPSLLDSPLFWEFLRHGLTLFALLIAALIVLAIGIRLILWGLALIRTGLHQLTRPNLNYELLPRHRER